MSRLREAGWLLLAVGFLGAALLSFAAHLRLIHIPYPHPAMDLLFVDPAGLIDEFTFPSTNPLIIDCRDDSAPGMSFLSPAGVTVFYWLPGLVFLALFFSARARRLRESGARS